MHFFSKITLASFAISALAHPGEHHEHNEAAELSKREFKTHARRGLAACAEKLQARGGVMERAAARRAATVAKHRQARGLAVRDTDSVLNTSHLSSEEYTPNTPANIIFASNKTCILNPEGEVGPYWVPGEYIRTNVRDNQPGVPIVLEGQFIDVETCETIPDLYWDVWNCNSTGVYSGLVANGNGNSADTSNYNATFLRGLQKTDADGVVTFESIFPRHYSGRTTHHHMVAHLNATVLPNNTLTGGTAAHVGQIFWDQDLINAVEATAPYNTNNVTLTTNADDHVFLAETEDSDSDPVLEYVYLGNDLSDGLFGWITIAVNVSATYDPSYSFVYTASGGVAQSGGSDSGNGAGGNGTMPSGAPPSGTAIPSGVPKR
ncbi:aromatic compound dioxygenase [Lindgomyces ingoldianus]|uniref:Aromatic compound dioxygenase n=1 Tax=Lindgomyces ingoldianus TaxID=673940 RepID=A0ACB6QQH6_9PLEO|nr:aromatic compound dioxygenase [Lindgomyces ingoldianus]KAF2469244.1 aromatic compound dioxygenase [Lindgomyces ingoldianus]